MWFSLPLRLNEGNQKGVSFICELGVFKSCTKTCHKRSELAKLFKTFGLMQFLPRHAEQFPCGGSGSSTASELWQMRTCQWGLKQTGMSQKMSKLRNPKFSKGVHFISRKLIFLKPSPYGNSVIVGSDHTMVMANLKFRWFAIDANMTPCVFSRFMISPES